MQNNLHLIFPTPILVDNINRAFTTDEENKFVNADYKNDVNDNTTTLNTVSFTRTKDILEEQSLFNIQDFILSKAREYLNSLRVSDNLKLKIIRSWMVKSEPGCYGRKHNHPNSILSGVMYLKTSKGCGNLILHQEKSLFGSIELSYGEVNNVNGTTVSIPPKDGMLILFPSTTYHEVAKNLSEETRYSLSFDIWAEGTIGTSNSMTELTL